MSLIIQTHNLTKYFSSSDGWKNLIRPRTLSQPAVFDINIEVNQGELFGLLGPNGAGKTTLIKLLSTLIVPTSGNASVFGYPLEQEGNIKKLIGLVTSDERSFYWRLTGRQNLEFFAGLCNLFGDHAEERINTTLEQVGLIDVANKQFQIYSTGMRQRLAIARALLNEPKLLFLDEPSSGLDPSATEKLHDLITHLPISKGITVFLTTHQLEEAEKLCDRIAIMDQGRIIEYGEIDALKKNIDTAHKIDLRITSNRQETFSSIKDLYPEIAVVPEKTDTGYDYLLTLESIRSTESLNTIIDLLRRGDVSILSITRQTPSLREIFNQIMSRRDSQNKNSSLDNNNTQEERTNSIQTRRIFSRISKPNIADFRIALSFIKRDWKIETSYRTSFILQFVGIFFSVAMFFFISELFGDSADEYLTRYNTDYFSFVLIGIAFSSYFSVGLSGFSRSIRQSQTTGTLEAMLSTPAKNTTIIFSSALWQYIMTTIRVLVYLLIGVLFMGVSFQNANITSAALIITLSILAFSSLGIVAASFIMVLKRGDPVTWVINSISSLLGGVYYPVNILPPALRLLALIIPITYTLDAMRLSLLSGYSVTQLSTQITVLIVFCVILVPTALIAFRYAVLKAKVDGSLTQF